MELLQIQTDDLRGFRYSFAKGEGLPMHSHGDNDVHITIVAKGSVAVHGPAIAREVIKAGEAVDFDANSPHEIIAEEDDTVIFNILKRAPIKGE